METDEESNHASKGQGHVGNGAGAAVTVGQRIDRICDAAGIVIKGSRDVVSEFKGLLDIEGRVDRNPYAMMAAAAGSGYVLGGGLFSPLTARILRFSLRFGLRLATSSLLQCERLGFDKVAGEDGEGSCAPKPKTSASEGNQPKEPL